MGAFFEAVKLFAMLLPLVVQLVQTAEKALPGAGQGAGKLGMVLNTIEAAATNAGQAAEEVQAMREPVTQLVGTVVSVFNQFDAWPSSD